MTEKLFKVRFGDHSFDMIENGDRIVGNIKKGGYEMETLLYWRDLCRDGSGTVLDIGAYTGIYSLLASSTGCLSFAFEVMPDVLHRLVSNIQINNANIAVMPFAASDLNGFSIFHYNKNSPMTTAGSLLTSPKKQSTITVRTLQIDSLNLPTISAIKLDVERGEKKVLDGAQNLIKRDRPTIIAEVLQGKTVEELLATLPSYKCVKQMDSRNFLFKPEEV